MRSTHKMQSKYQNVPQLQSLGDGATWAVACLHLDTLCVTPMPTQRWAKQGEILGLSVIQILRCSGLCYPKGGEAMDPRLSGPAAQLWSGSGVWAVRAVKLPSVLWA